MRIIKYKTIFFAIAILLILGAGVAASVRWPEVKIRQEEDSK